MYELPAYLVWGFLESGKSTLIKETLSQDYFNDGEKTMILTFEEGEVEYDKEMLEKTNSFVVNIENMEDCQRMSEKLLSRPCHDRIQWNVLY
jgi:putative membrane protein